MNDLNRRYEQNSPKSSPRGGSRSPAVQRPDTTGTLRTTISLGKNPAVIHTGPFYLMKELPEEAPLLGSKNLIQLYQLQHSYDKFSGKKVKDELSAFLPNLPGNIDAPGIQDNSSLRSLIEKPPITGKEILPLSGAALTGFRLHPGPLPEQYRLMSQIPQKKKKHKKHKKEPGKEGPLQESQDNTTDSYERKHKKQKRSEEEREKRKKKKEKKKKKKHSPDHSSSAPAETGAKSTT